MLRPAHIIIKKYLFRLRRIQQIEDIGQLKNMQMNLRKYFNKCMHIF